VHQSIGETLSRVIKNLGLEPQLEPAAGSGQPAVANN